MRLCTILVILCVGCSLFEAETPTNSFKQIKESACKGSIDQFYSRVDWGSIKKKIVRKVSGENVFIESFAEKVANDARQEWDDDIRLGHSGSWCGAILIDSEGSTVFWATPTGKQKEGTFELVNGKYLLVDLK